MVKLEKVLKVNNLFVSVCIDTQLCMITGLDSSTGKSYLAKVLSDEFQNSCVIINYNVSIREDVIYGMLSGSKSLIDDSNSIIIFDNADLYISERILERAKVLYNTVIVIGRKKFTRNIHKGEWYRVEFTGRELVLERGF